MSDTIIPLILDHLAGGVLGLISAGLASYFGTRDAERLPGESFLPRCLYCQRPLEWHEAFPLFGWLLRDNASTLPCPCGKRKGLWIQPVTEIAGFFLGMIAVAFAGAHWTSALFPLCLGLGLLPAIAAIDWAYGIIPDMLNLLLALFGLGWLVMGGGDVFMSLIGSAGLLALGLLLALGYSKWRKREMLGLGDVKFFAAAGLWLPVIIVPWFLAAAGFLGAGLGLVWKLTKGSDEFPFAPALCLSLAGSVFYALAFPL